MSTIHQIRANRQNSQHSTGPQSDAGKRVSSLNATRHGFTGHVLILNAEDLGQYDIFSRSYRADLAPVGEVESQLAQTIIDNQWRLNTIRSHESAIFAHMHLGPISAAVMEVADAGARNVLIEAAAWSAHERELRNLSIYESRIFRQFSQALKQLTDRQASRANAEVAEVITIQKAAAAKTYYESNGLQFNPKEFGFLYSNQEIQKFIGRTTTVRKAKTFAAGAGS